MLCIMSPEHFYNWRSIPFNHLHPILPPPSPSFLLLYSQNACDTTHVGFPPRLVISQTPLSVPQFNSTTI